MITFVRNILSTSEQTQKSLKPLPTLVSKTCVNMEQLWWHESSHIFGTAANFNNTLEGTFIHREQKTTTIAHS